MYRGSQKGKRYQSFNVKGCLPLWPHENSKCYKRQESHPGSWIASSLCEPSWHIEAKNDTYNDHNSDHQTSSVHEDEMSWQCYLEGQGDLVSGLITGIIGVTIWVIGVIKLLTKYP